MTDKNFIQRIKFNTNYFPFEKDSKIIFGGENEMQKLIEFYLKTVKKIKKGDKLHDFKENADRFKINCILGNNGGGKSRLIERLLKYKKYTNGTDSGVLDLTEIKDDDITINDGSFNIVENKIILDDFFVLSPNISSSVNNYLMNIQGHNYSLCNIFNFLIRNDTINKIYSEFLDEKINNDGKLNIKLEIDFTINPKKNIYKELSDNYKKSFKANEISDIEFEKFISKIMTSYGFGGKFLVNTDSNISDFKNVSKFLESEDIFFYILLTTCVLKDLIKFIDYVGKANPGINEIDNNIFHNFVEFFEKSNIKIGGDSEKEKLLTKINNIYGNLNNELSNATYNVDIYEKQIADILKEVYLKIKNGYKINVNNECQFCNFSEMEIKFLSEHFDIDLTFKNKTFNNLSSGQKLILTRFTNIYMEIVNTNNYNIKTFTILIDEPDLHLHLDWQKKYIQKLIDVFSTIDLRYKLHFIIATHSPFIISDLPSECIILLDKQKGSEYTKITDYDLNIQSLDKKIIKKTFGANFINIINDGFFFNDKVLMGSFSEINIKGFAIAQRFLMIGLKKIKDTNLDDNEKRIYEFLKKSGISNIKDLELYIDNIGDTFLKDNLIYL